VFSIDRMCVCAGVVCERVSSVQGSDPSSFEVATPPQLWHLCPCALGFAPHFASRLAAPCPIRKQAPEAEDERQGGGGGGRETGGLVEEGVAEGVREGGCGGMREGAFARLTDTRQAPEAILQTQDRHLRPYRHKTGT
jgi:hypothetical protein